MPRRGAPSSGDVIASASVEGWNATGAFAYASSRRRRAVSVRSSGVAPQTLSPQKKWATAVRCGVLPTARSIATCSASHIASSAAPTRRLCAGSSSFSRSRSARGNGSCAPAANIDGLICRRPTPDDADQPRAAAALAVRQRGQHEGIALRLGGDLAHDARDLGQALVARHLAAQVDHGGVEARGVDRSGDGRRLGGPAARILQLVDAALQRDRGRALPQAGDDVALGGGSEAAGATFALAPVRASGISAAIRTRDSGASVASIYVRVCHIGEHRQIFSHFPRLRGSADAMGFLTRHATVVA